MDLFAAAGLGSVANVGNTPVVQRWFPASARWLRPHVYLSVLRGIVYCADWVANDRSRAGMRVPELPADLLREVGAAVAMRRPEALRLAMDGSLAMLRRLGKNADARFRESLIVGLDYLSTEAAYRELADGAGTIPYEYVPTIRTYAVKLAKLLSDAGHGSHPVIRQWLEAARTDPLPEVRAAISGEPTSDDDE